MTRSRKLGMIRAAAFIGAASFVLVGCSSGGDISAPSPSDDGTDLATAKVTPVGTWVLGTDDSVELVVDTDGSYVFKPCSASGRWSDQGAYFSAASESMLDVGGCPETIDLALIDRITVEGETLIVSDSEGNKEAFQKISD